MLVKFRSRILFLKLLLNVLNNNYVFLKLKAEVIKEIKRSLLDKMGKNIHKITY